MKSFLLFATLLAGFFYQSTEAKDFNPRTCTRGAWVLIIDGTASPNEVSTTLEVVNHAKQSLVITGKFLEGKTLIYHLGVNPTNNGSKREMALQARAVESIIAITKRYPKVEFYCWAE